MQKFQEIANLSRKELLQEMEKVLAELHELRLSNRMNQLKETHKITLAKRRVAHIHTALRQTESLSGTSETVAQEEITGQVPQKTAVQKKKRVTKKKPVAANKKSL
jgi:ribosomal protein L29